MVSYTINLFASDNLQDYCESEYNNGLRALERAQTYFEGAFSQESNHSATINTQSLRVPAPIECYTTYEYSECNNGNGFYSEPCVDPIYYEWLHVWFYDWLVCNTSSWYGADLNLLLTNFNNTGGGAVDGNAGVGVAQTGRYIADLPSYYTDHGWSNGHNAMATALHEFGHYAMGNATNQHHRGDNIYHYNGWTVTPMLYPSEVSYNECGENILINEEDGYSMWWDDCCTGEWN